VELRTERLDLRHPVPEDCDQLFAIFNDPKGWLYEPESRHLERPVTEGFITRAAARWVNDGLSYWTARLIGSDQIIGIGGVQRHSSGHWNLSYRLGTEQQGHGYAAELGRAGIQAAQQADPEAAVIAWINETNLPSRRVAERLGLILRGTFIDQNDGKPRMALTDRVVELPAV